MEKTIVLTGAARGIGYEAALQFAAKGCRVVAISRNSSLLEILKALAPEKILVLPFDLASGKFSEVVAFLKNNGIVQIDGLVNNAGLLINKPFEEITAADLKACFEVNAFAPYLLTQLLLPFMKKARTAHVVNISSMGGFQGVQKFPGLSAYSSSKAALVNITECLAEELKATTVKVNCLCLGAVQTEMLAEAFPGYQAPIMADEMAAFIVNFTLNNHLIMHGKIIPVALSTP